MRAFLAFILTAAGLVSSHKETQRPVKASSNVIVNGIPYATRARWIRFANEVLAVTGSPCPFAAFSSVIVNHTSTSSLGDLICIGVNDIASGDPTLHGEIQAIRNCTAILGDPKGEYKLSGAEISLAWRDLTLYTNAESCPMCASAIRWAGFKEYVFGLSSDVMLGQGWDMIDIDSREVFQRAWNIGTTTAYVGSVLANETDPYFAWQFQSGTACPSGCSRSGDEGCAAE